tara:strand:- start:159 stop:677 length:519 start_codon:yes stop_codon:yes gene_type:complete
MIILGVDPGTRELGYGVLEESEGKITAKDYGSLSFPSSLPIEERLYQIHSHILNMVGIFAPNEIAVEEPFLGQGSNQYVGPAFAVGQAQAAVLIAAASQRVPIFRYPPTQVKSSITDHGRASKEQVQNMVQITLGLGKDATDSLDATDALAVALCHLYNRTYTSMLQKRKFD